MSEGLHEIYLGQGDQPVVHVPPVRVDPAAGGLPSYSIEDLTEGLGSAGRVIASGPATVDALNAPLTAESGALSSDPRRVYVAPGAALVGHTYALELEDGASEPVRLAGVAVAYATAASDISASYPATTSALRGVELSATFPAADAAREELQEEDRPLRVVWTYQIGGRLVLTRDQIRVVRQTGEPQYIGRAEVTLREEWGELVRALGQRPNSVRNVVVGCARELAVKLRARRIPPAGFLAGPLGFEVLISRCVWKCGQLGHKPGEHDLTEWTSEAKRDYLNLWGALVVGSPGVDTAEVSRTDDTAPAGSSRRSRSFIRRK